MAQRGHGELAQHAARLHDTQTPLAEALFAGVALMAAGSWIAVAMHLGRAVRRASRSGLPARAGVGWNDQSSAPGLTG